MRVPIDETAVAAADPSGLLDAYLATGRRLREAYHLGGSIRVPPVPDARSVTFCAMGGSAAAADAVAAAFDASAPMPLVTVRDHGLPGHCDERSLVVCLSYSGNTEETLSAFDEALARGCAVVAVCSGGALARRAAEGSVPVVLLPPDLPQPRAALGSLVGGTLGALVSAGAVPAADAEVADAAETLETLVLELGAGPPAETILARDLATWIGERLPIVWSSGAVGAAAAWRWKCAFNENAKVPAFASVLPELDHHEVVGWSNDRGRGFALVVLRHGTEHPTLPLRLEATLEVVAGARLEHRAVDARGESALAHVLSLMVLGDAASVHHALARGVDPAPIEAIDRLKRRLAGER